MPINKALIQSFNQAANFLDDLRNSYSATKQARDKIVLYQAATNSQFNAAVNAIIPAPDRVRIAALKTFYDTLILEMETNYDDFINPV